MHVRNMAKKNHINVAKKNQNGFCKKGHWVGAPTRQRLQLWSSPGEKDWRSLGFPDACVFIYTTCCFVVQHCDVRLAAAAVLITRKWKVNGYKVFCLTRRSRNLATCSWQVAMGLAIQKKSGGFLGETPATFGG